MVKIVMFEGGLGNQMFIYSFYYVLNREAKLSFVDIDIENTYGQHNGFELFNIFTAIKPKSAKYYRRVKNLTIKYWTKYLFQQSLEDTVQRIPINDFYPFTIYTGFWQSDFYFRKYSNDIRRLFTFNVTKLNQESIELLSELQQSNTVSLHIRRGDYTWHSEFDGICSESYYRSAIEIIHRRVSNPCFYIFTNDPIWVKQNFDLVKYKLVDWNYDKDSWQDMCLMSNCNHNIIANSSFSWWSAWLNKNPDKIVITPSKWFNTLQTNHNVPLDWVRL